MDVKIDSNSSSSSDDPSDPETSDTSNQTEKQSSDGQQTPPLNTEIPFKIELDSTISQDSGALPNPPETSGQSASPAKCDDEKKPSAKTEEQNPPENVTIEKRLEVAVSGANLPTNSNASGEEKYVPVLNQPGTPDQSTASSKCKDEVEQLVKITDQNPSEDLGIESLEGAVGGAHLVFTDPSACKKELNAAITEDRYQDCYERLFTSFARQKAKQAKDAKTREKCGIYGEAKLEHYENREEICTRGWLKYSLPREAEFLDSTTQNPAATPPDLQEDLIYSLSLGILSKEERSKWEKAVLLGNKLKEIAEIASRADRQDELQTCRVNFVELLSNIVWELEEQLGLSDPKRHGSFNPSLCEEDTSTGIPLLRTDSSNTDPDMPELESDAAFEK